MEPVANRVISATQMAIGSLQSTFQASLTPPQVVLKVETSQLAKAGTIKVQNGKTASIFIENGDDGVFSDAFSTTSAEETAENLNPNAKTSLALDGGTGVSEPYLDEAHYANEGDAEEQIIIKKAGNYLLTLNAVFQGGSSRANPRLSVK